MFMWHWMIFLIFIRNAAAMADQDQNGYLNDEEWVNPFDMINYDRASKSMLKPSLAVTGDRKDSGRDIDLLMSEVKSLKNEVEHCKAAFTNCSRHINIMRNVADSSLVASSSSPTQSSSAAAQQAKSSSNKQEECERNKYFMKRFVNLFLKASKLTEEMPASLETYVEVKVSLEQLTILQQFGKGSSEISLQELDDVFSKILIGSTTNVVYEYLTWWKPESFAISVSKEALLMCILLFLPVICLWKIARGHKVASILSVIFFTIFVTSFSITYYKMLKEAEIKQYSAMQKNLERQTECRSLSELSWFERLRLQVSSRRDECEELHRKAILEPFFEVTPALVLSQMLSESLLHPAANLGSAITEFSKPILGKLPFGTNYIVLFSSLLIIMMVLFVCVGGQISLPFFLGSFGLSNRGNPAAAVNQAQAPSETPSIQEHVDHRTVKHMIRKEVVRALSVGSAPLFQEKVVEVKHLPDTDDTNSEMKNEGAVHKPCCCGDSIHLQQLDHETCLERNDLHQEIVLVRAVGRKSSLKGRKCSLHSETVKTETELCAGTSRAQCDCQCSSDKKHSVTYVTKIAKIANKVQRLKRDAEEEQSSELSDESTDS